MLFFDERGGVSAEFAITLPAVMLIVGVVFGGLALSAEKIAIASAANEIARLEARQDHSQAAERLRGIPAGTTVSRSETGTLICVTLQKNGERGILRALEIKSTGCAAQLWKTE